MGGQEVFRLMFSSHIVWLAFFTFDSALVNENVVSGCKTSYFVIPISYLSLKGAGILDWIKYTVTDILFSDGSTVAVFLVSGNCFGLVDFVNH